MSVVRASCSEGRSGFNLTLTTAGGGSGSNVTSTSRCKNDSERQQEAGCRIISILHFNSSTQFLLDSQNKSKLFNIFITLLPYRDRCNKVYGSYSPCAPVALPFCTSSRLWLLFSFLQAASSAFFPRYHVVYIGDLDYCKRVYWAFEVRLGFQVLIL